MTPTRSALVQMRVESGKAKNTARAKEYVAEAASNGAKIVCLQELFNSVYFAFVEDPKYWDFAEPIPGPTVDEMAAVAAKHKIVLIACIYEKAMKGELYNTAVVLGPDGAIMGKYRKTSIPLVRTADVVGNEKFYFRPGNLGFPVWPTPFGVNIGVMICYDRHFPEHARLLALNGADLIFVPTATSGREGWEIELQAHAISNMFYVGGVNRVGVDEDGPPNKKYFGRSLFCDPKGQILSQAGESGDEVVYADIDVSVIEELRNTKAFFRDRRPELYGAIAK